jgi:uncharacterized protein YprB with RNaseH-like and TPR domain
MLKHTFRHIHGIGEKTEQRIWAAGLTTWEEFIDAPQRAPLAQWQRDIACTEIEYSLRALEQRNAHYFAERLSGALRWRLYPEFAQRTAFLDIETTGDMSGSSITVIGIYDGERPAVYIQGQNLSNFITDIEQFTLLVTYNGTLFDLPVIRQEFGIPLPQAHIDLRYPLAALDYKGGLKKIERSLGLEREGPVALLDGWCAVYLWHYYQRGENAALETLLRYNLEDVIHLPTLLALVYNSRVSRLPFSVPLIQFSPPPVLPFGFDEQIIMRTLIATGRGNELLAATSGASLFP